MAGYLSITVLALVLRSVADQRSELPPCSREMTALQPPPNAVRLFELHKDLNPANVLMIHTYADSRCRLIGSIEDKDLLVDMYWRMNSGSPDECYKPTDPRIKSETLKTLDVKSIAGDRTRFRIDITQLDQVDHDLPTREVEVTLERTSSGCEAETRLLLEPHGDAVIRLLEINATGKYVLGVPRTGVETLELIGRDERNRPIRRMYRAR